MFYVQKIWVKIHFIFPFFKYLFYDHFWKYMQPIVLILGNIKHWIIFKVDGQISLEVPLYA